MNDPAAATDPRWFYRRGALTRDGWESFVGDRIPGWRHTGLRVAVLDAGVEMTLDGAAREDIVIPLSGSFEVTYAAPDRRGDVARELGGRTGVFAGPTDVLYLPARVPSTIRGSGRIAIASALTDVAKPVRYIAATEVPLELRGGGSSSRQVHNFGTVGVLDAARLIVCEVITPAGNWSSYPPHKHDEHVPGVESKLEEIYYFEAAVDRSAGGGVAGASDDAAFGLFSTYSSPAGRIDINAMVRTGDIALVPHGYHGPAVAAPGYHLYYLNVMAGPGRDRAWNITDDPAHAWVRDVWAGEGIDPRLPMTGNGE